MHEQTRLIDIEAPLLHPLLDAPKVLALMVALVDAKGYAGSVQLVSAYLQMPAFSKPYLSPHCMGNTVKSALHLVECSR